MSKTTLTKEQADALKIQAKPIENQEVQAHIELTGWVMAKQGNEVTITAPVAGYVRAPADPRNLPIAGLAVRQGQELFSIEPVLSALDQVQVASLKRGVENDLAKAKESVRVAETELTRLQTLKAQGVRNQQDVDQAQLKLTQAKADQSAAEDKLKIYIGSPDGSGPQLKPLSIHAPRAATVLTVLVAPGQYVSASAPLATLADLSQLWVRVPVPEYDLPRVDRGKSVVITWKTAGGSTGKKRGAGNVQHFDATYLTLVPQVDTARHTADLIYELSTVPRSVAASKEVVMAPTGSSPLAAGLGAPAPHANPPPPVGGGQGRGAFFAKDQMVTVFVPLGERRKATVVPYSAVVFDAFAGSWIYVEKSPPTKEPGVYERRRVELGAVVPEGVIIRPGVKSGERVVVNGAAALFSREFYKPPPVAGGPAEEVDDDD